MRVRLKGLNRVTKTLADGSRATYYYAWKGGPRLPGKPEFMAAYNAAVAAKVEAPTGKLKSVLDAYERSPPVSPTSPHGRGKTTFETSG